MGGFGQLLMKNGLNLNLVNFVLPFFGPSDIFQPYQYILHVDQMLYYQCKQKNLCAIIMLGLKSYVKTTQKRKFTRK